jgi:hypothetical protein
METKPTIKLIGKDGNAFAILAECRKVGRKAGWTPSMVEYFIREATRGDYDHLLAVVQQYFEVE